MFPVGSVTKIFTGIMLAYLVNEGTATLEDRAAAYLPASVAGSGGAIRNVTLLDLATHTSGMTDAAPGNPAEQVYFDLPPLPDLIDDWIRWRPTPPSAGDPYLYYYSNKGFLTLAFAVAQAAGRAGYNPLFQEVFRDPLRLTYLQTLGTMTPALRDLLTVAYGDSDDPSDQVGNGVNANLIDFEPFLRACLLNRETPDRLKRAVEFSQRPFRSKLLNNPNLRMGLGWDLNLAAPRTVTKGGATAGAFSFLRLLPQENIGVVILANGKPSTGNDIGRLAADLLDRVTPNADRELAGGKPTSQSRGDGRRRPNDGDKTGITLWAGSSADDWWQVDLEAPRCIGYFHVIPEWNGTSASGYTIHASTDARQWSLVVDVRPSTTPDTLAGNGHWVAPQFARYLRIQGVDKPLRLVEFEVFEHPERASAALEIAQPAIHVVREGNGQISALKYSYRQPAENSSLGYTVESSSDLLRWRRLAATWKGPMVTADPLGGPFEVVAWETVASDADGADHGFIRLSVSPQ